MTLVGGREIHPINVRVGGFYRAPTRRELEAHVEPLERAREAALETVRWTAGFDFPERTVECELVALSHPDDYAIERGRIVSDAGLDISPAEYDEHFEELHVERSTALHSRLRERGTYLCGPLARYTLNYDQLSPLARRGSARGGPRARVPRPVPEHRRSQRRARLRVRRGAAADRGLRGAGRAGGRDRAGRGHRLRRERGAARPALPPLPPRRRGHDPRREDRPADLAEPARDRGRPPRRRRAQHAPRRRPAARPLRADDPQLRPVHLLRHALPHPRGRAAMSGAPTCVQPLYLAPAMAHLSPLICRGFPDGGASRPRFVTLSFL